MDYNCREIPMRLDIRYQPLNFEIYLSQVIEIPQTSLDIQPYNFQLEVEALQTVDKIIEATQKENEKLIRSLEKEKCEQEQRQNQQQTPSIPVTDGTSQPSEISPNVLVESATLPPPSCPAETPLTPIKTTVSQQTDSSNINLPPNAGIVNQINPKDFEDTHYNPFDHLELQTIDERRELDLVFQASYAYHGSNNQLQPTTSESSTPQSNTANTLTKS